MTTSFEISVDFENNRSSTVVETNEAWWRNNGVAENLIEKYCTNVFGLESEVNVDYLGGSGKNLSFFVMVSEKNGTEHHGCVYANALN